MSKNFLFGTMALVLTLATGAAQADSNSSTISQSGLSNQVGIDQVSGAGNSFYGNQQGDSNIIGFLNEGVFQPFLQNGNSNNASINQYGNRNSVGPGIYFTDSGY